MTDVTAFHDQAMKELQRRISLQAIAFADAGLWLDVRLGHCHKDGEPYQCEIEIWMNKEHDLYDFDSFFVVWDGDATDTIENLWKEIDKFLKETRAKCRAG